MARRTIGSLAAVVLATVIAGCGGGEESDLADATNRTCESVTAAAETLRTDLVRGPGDDEASAVKAAIERYVRTVSTAADGLQEAKPTKAEREFQRQAVTRLRAHADDLRAAATGSSDGGESRADALKRLVASEDAASPMVPPAVIDGAPACGGAAR
jgi:chemotaxis response regulator CheB